MSAKTRVRKNFKKLSKAERKHFAEVVYQVKHPIPPLTADNYSQFPTLHNSIGNRFVYPIHGNIAFLAWHRAFLLHFEEEVRKIDPTLTIPYWDWTVYNSPDGTRRNGQIWHDDFMGPNGVAADSNFIPDPIGGSSGTTRFFSKSLWKFGSDPLQRELAQNSNSPMPTKKDIENILSTKAFDTKPYDHRSPTDSFRNLLEGWVFLSDYSLAAESIGPHNYGHVWVGGTVGTFNSPRDPIFWLHHCYIDYLWAKWQFRHPKKAEQYPEHSDIVNTRNETNPLMKNTRATTLGDVLIPYDGTAGKFYINTNKVLNHQKIYIDDPTATSGNPPLDMSYSYDTDRTFDFKFT
jgi:tyrosinase